MREQSESETPESQEERLLQWRAKIITVLSQSAYRGVAEDAAHELICKMLRKAREGAAIPPCPVRVPKLSKWEALRIARSLSTESRVVELACDLIPSPEGDEPTEKVLTKMRWLEAEFAAGDLEKLLTAIRSGECSHSDYAKAIGKSLRTFENRLHNLRTAAQVRAKYP